MDATTGLLTWVGGRRRKDSGLFIELLGKLKEAYAGKRAIHVILDNYTIHSSKRTRAWLAEHGGMAALRRARKVGLIEEAPREMEVLQWGRAPESAEGPAIVTIGDFNICALVCARYRHLSADKAMVNEEIIHK